MGVYITSGTHLERGVFDRLWAEAEPYSEHMVARAGDSYDLGEDIWRTSQKDSTITRLIYASDNYLVGACLLSEPFEDKGVVMIESLLFGQDKEGSRSWFYDEGFQRDTKEWMLEEGYREIIVPVVPKQSRAVRAMENFWSANFNGRRYFEVPTYEIPEVRFTGDLSYFNERPNYRIMVIRPVK